MSQQIFGVFDDVAESFVSVFVAPDDGTAVRLFRNACLDPLTCLAKDPSSYALFACGELDSSTHTFRGGLGKRISRALDHVSPPSVSSPPVSEEKKDAPPHIEDVTFMNRG